MFEAARCAKQAANEMALEEVDQFLFDQRISLAVVTIGGDEGEIDIQARSDIWSGSFCAPRIFVKVTCSAFHQELEGTRKEDYTRYVPKKVQPQDRAHHREQQDLWTTLRAICRERPSAAGCLHGANPAWSRQSGCLEGTNNPYGPTAKAERPKDAKLAEDLQKEWNEMQMEGEEASWAGMGMDEAQ